MKPVVLTDERKRRRAKNNLDNFDAELIRAELSALEGGVQKVDRVQKVEKKEGLDEGLDGGGEEHEVLDSAEQSSNGAAQRESRAQINTIDFNLGNSKLLHKAVRMVAQNPKLKVEDKPRYKSAPEVNLGANKLNRLNPDAKNNAGIKLSAKKYGDRYGDRQDDARNEGSNLKSGNGPRGASSGLKSPLEKKAVKQVLAQNDGSGVSLGAVESQAKLNAAGARSFSAQAIRPRSMDAFARTSQVKPELAREEVRPERSSVELATSGMYRANQFNEFLQNTQRTNLQNQIEKQQLFPSEIKPGSVVYDHGVKSSALNRYNPIKNSHKMLGGVDQHNLGSGTVRRFFSMRSVKFLMPVAVVMIAGAYIFYLNMPKLSLKLAEGKSGISISAPSYVPDHFSLNNKVETETGRVTMNFVNGDDSYSVSQSVSDWDSAALLEDKVLKETKEYSAYTDRGLTIYVYGNKAVWMNQGKVNEISLNGTSLDVEEMIRIAGSM